MTSAYDYQELIDELKDEMGDGLLEKSETIQVLRGDEALADGYYPIIDWHYNSKQMALDLAPDSTDTKEEIKEKAMIKEQYERDLSFLSNMTVEACLTEMFERTNK